MGLLVAQPGIKTQRPQNHIAEGKAYFRLLFLLQGLCQKIKKAPRPAEIAIQRPVVFPGLKKPDGPICAKDDKLSENRQFGRKKNRKEHRDKYVYRPGHSPFCLRITRLAGT